MPSLVEIVEGINDALQPLTSELDGIQIYPYWVRNPSPPCLDVYPADPFQAPSAFGPEVRALFFTVRARVSLSDLEAGQKTLLALLDPAAATSVEQLLTADGLGLDLGVGLPSGEGPTGYRTYEDGLGGEFLGVEWRLEVLT